MSTRFVAAAALFACIGTSALAAQAPFASGSLQLPTALGVGVRNAVVKTAVGYPFVGVQLFGRDSALLVFDDSTLTGTALGAHTWMFGPPVTAAETDGCPPEKVLGRKIARAFWTSSGRPVETQYVIVAVRGTQGRDRWTYEKMYYQHSQLDGPWAGDRAIR
jgi:hypothetical protein